jgi:hypothetical protein
MRNHSPIQWPEEINHVPSRMEQVHQERCWNHVTPVPPSPLEWNLVDDAQLVHYYKTMGPQWMYFTRLLGGGRYCDSVKSRFHYIRRSLAKDAAKVDLTVRSDSLQVKEGIMKRLVNFISPEDDFEKSIVDMVDIIANCVHLKRKLSMQLSNAPKAFDLVRVPDAELECCSRCGLLVPSEQTGEKICQTTKWCESCTSTPAYFCGDILRLAHGELQHSSEITSQRAI